MDLREALGRMKPLLGAATLLVAAGAWLLVYASDWQAGEWAGFWSSNTGLRGDSVDIAGHTVETPAERDKKEALKRKHVDETLYQTQKKVLGDRQKTVGDEILPERPKVPEMFRSTEREACQEMQLEYPDKYGNVDCMNPEIRDDPWLPGAPERDDDDDTSATVKKAPDLGPGWPANTRKSPLGNPELREPTGPVAAPRAPRKPSPPPDDDPGDDVRVDPEDRSR